MLHRDVAELRSSGTLTGRHLDHRVRLREHLRHPRGQLSITGATLHNLKDVDVDIPLGVLTVVTGVAGSGKSSLIHGSLSGRDGVIVVDQAAIRGSRRSNPATYTGLLSCLQRARSSERTDPGTRSTTTCLNFFGQFGPHDQLNPRRRRTIRAGRSSALPQRPSDLPWFQIITGHGRNGVAASLTVG